MTKVRIGHISIGSRVATFAHRHEVQDFVSRHAMGDWGTCTASEVSTNEASLATGCWVISKFRAACGHEVWVITVGDRTSTLIRCPRPIL